MANALYDAGREAFLTGAINVASDTIKVILVDTGAYTVNTATHNALDDVPAGARIAEATLGSKTTTGGVFDAADTTFTSVTGNQSEALVIFKDAGGAESGDALIAYIDTATGLPVTPNGGNITVTWDNGANKIFKL